MTKTIKILFLLFIVSILSCSKEENNSSNGKIINGDDEYELNYAYLSSKDKDLGIFQVYLSSDIITFQDSIRKFSDNAETTIELAFFNGKNFNQGISNYYPLFAGENGQTRYEPPYLVASAINFGLKKVSGNEEPEERYHYWTDGSTTIVKENDTYRLDFTFIRGDKIITGYYNGIIQIVD
ncbi:MAG: hypothetical protein ACQEWG_16325 [Bacteroidota bacterium]